MDSEESPLDVLSRAATMVSPSTYGKCGLHFFLIFPRESGFLKISDYLPSGSIISRIKKKRSNRSQTAFPYSPLFGTVREGKVGWVFAVILWLNEKVSRNDADVCKSWEMNISWFITESHEPSSFFRFQSRKTRTVEQTRLYLSCFSYLIVNCFAARYALLNKKRWMKNWFQN